MSYSPDLIHLQNMIMRAVESIDGDGSVDGKFREYSKLICFLEDMYINSVLALAGSVLKGVERAPDHEIEGLIELARLTLTAAPGEVDRKMMEKYRRMVEEFNMVDVFAEKSHNETVAEEILAENGE